MNAICLKLVTYVFGTRRQQQGIVMTVFSSGLARLRAGITAALPCLQRWTIPYAARRSAKILKHIQRDAWGVEIGPSYGPLAPKREGYRVHVIDHLNREQLIEKYRAHGISVEKIEEVDFVWHGEPYAQLTGHTKHYQWIIGSHLVEHTPDLIGFLKNCAAILKDDGVLSLAVPDARYCFDHFRPLTSLGSVIDAHLGGRVMQTPGTVCDSKLNAVSRKGRIAWSAGTTGAYGFVHNLEEVRTLLKQSLAQTEYIDTHAWCFTPTSFRLLMHDLHELGFSPFRELSFFPTDGCEFYMTLGLQSDQPKPDRLALLQTIRRELNAG